jgi:hypothetical protein
LLYGKEGQDETDNRDMEAYKPWFDISSSTANLLENYILEPYFEPGSQKSDIIKKYTFKSENGDDLDITKEKAYRENILETIDRTDFMTMSVLYTALYILIKNDIFFKNIIITESNIKSGITNMADETELKKVSFMEQKQAEAKKAGREWNEEAAEAQFAATLTSEKEEKSYEIQVPNLDRILTFIIEMLKYDESYIQPYSFRKGANRPNTRLINITAKKVIENMEILLEEELANDYDDTVAVDRAIKDSIVFNADVSFKGDYKKEEFKISQNDYPSDVVPYKDIYELKRNPGDDIDKLTSIPSKAIEMLSKVLKQVLSPKWNEDGSPMNIHTNSSEEFELNNNILSYRIFERLKKIDLLFTIILSNDFNTLLNNLSPLLGDKTLLHHPGGLVSNGFGVWLKKNKDDDKTKIILNCIYNTLNNPLLQLEGIIDTIDFTIIRIIQESKPFMQTRSLIQNGISGLTLGGGIGAGFSLGISASADINLPSIPIGLLLSSSYHGSEYSTPNDTNIYVTETYNKNYNNSVKGLPEAHTNRIFGTYLPDLELFSKLSPESIDFQSYLHNLKELLISMAALMSKFIYNLDIINSHIDFKAVDMNSVGAQEIIKQIKSSYNIKEYSVEPVKKTVKGLDDTRVYSYSKQKTRDRFKQLESEGTTTQNPLSEQGILDLSEDMEMEQQESPVETMQNPLLPKAMEQTPDKKQKKKQTNPKINKQKFTNPLSDIQGHEGEGHEGGSVGDEESEPPTLAAAKHRPGPVPPAVGGGAAPPPPPAGGRLCLFFYASSVRGELART